MSSRKYVVVIAVVAALIVAAAAVWRWRRLEAVADPGSAGAYSVENVPVASPELKVVVGTVRWTAHDSYTDWGCMVECREEDGCHAEIQLVVDYLSEDEEQRLTLGGRLDAAFGETVRIGRAQRPSVPVDRVERVSIKVLGSFRSGAPTPTPME